MELKPFTRIDWDGFAGAERGENGEEPQIGYTTAYNQDVAVLVDRSGISLFFLEHEDTPLRAWDLRVTYYTGLAVAAAFQEPLTMEQVRRFGFVQSL